ncbi:MAG: hypothetical protein LBH20_00800 [Treponema sp.]|nr:hypothetical protein [Treponema sp.]
MACKSSPAAIEPMGEAAAFAADFDEEELILDHLTVSQELYDFTFTEVKHFVDNLNTTIRRKDYSGWKDALSDGLFTHFSSPEFLAKASESNLLRSRKIILKTPNDYFINVVVPSRSNSRVDEIEFTAHNTVKVFYLEKLEKKTENNAVVTETRRLRLYELEKSGDSWKIID